MQSQTAVQAATTEPVSEIEEIYRSIASGEKRWEDYTFIERTCKGWLLPYLLDLDLMFWRRWDYWLETLEAGKLLDRPIPRLHILSGVEEGKEARQMLMTCLEHQRAYAHGITLVDFLEWLLWGFGDPDQTERPRKVREDLNEFWYRNFNLGLLLKYPKDYFGDIYADERSPMSKQRSGFFPTPETVCECMVRMAFGGEKRDTRSMSVCEPCVGTGRMLMHASNYSLNLWGADIDYGCVLACKVNGYLYMPWLVRPAPWFDNGMERGDALRTPFTETVPAKNDQSKKVIPIHSRQLSLFHL
jgi:hypothetical protein